MKALGILKKLKEKDITFRKICKINEAIEELENLKNRSCATCKYGRRSNNFEDDIDCENFGANTHGLYFEKNFYCKNWEPKGK